MEVIGDSTLVDAAREQQLDAFEKDSVEFERNLDDLKQNLENEETRLVELEHRRAKLEKEIEQMYEDIKDEKECYRTAMSKVIEERERISRAFIESCQPLDDLQIIESSTSLLDKCQAAIEENKEMDLNVEKIRCDLMENFITTKEDYLSTMKDHIQQKQLKLSLQLEQHSQQAE